MKDNLDKKLEKSVKVELKVGEFYLLSLIASKAIGQSRKILKYEHLDEEVLKAMNTILSYEIPRIAFKVMDQIGILKIANIISKDMKGSRNEKY